MKVNIFTAIIILFAFSGCGHENKQVEYTAPETIPSDTFIANGTDTMRLSAALSENEMKDDSVFKDGSIPTSWANAGVTDVKGLKLFLKQLQVWVMNNDKRNIATAIAYPLKEIKNEQAFIAAYDKIFTKEVKLSFATINFNQLFRNQHGVMTDGGKVWIQQFDSAFKIFAINP